MKLTYFSPIDRSGKVRWLLEELGLPFELQELDFEKKENESPSHLAKHPMGAVPVLEDGGLVMFESNAICAYLADKYIEKGLAPAFTSPLRAAYQQWMYFSVATIDNLAERRRA
ncbi:MAG: glutathione S-transferase family protein, partial [Bdellovibrionota bacterium]